MLISLNKHVIKVLLIIASSMKKLEKELVNITTKQVIVRKIGKESF